LLHVEMHFLIDCCRFTVTADAPIIHQWYHFIIAVIRNADAATIN
jgi:hypothetical protein